MNDDNKLKNKIKLYRIGVVILLIIIFFITESYFGALNHIKDMNETLTLQLESSYSEGYQAGYDKAIKELP